MDFCNMTNSEIKMIIDEKINGRNAKRNREILKMRLIDGLTYERLAEMFDISTVQAKRIVYKCEISLFK